MGILEPFTGGRFRDRDDGTIGYLVRSGSTVTFDEVDDWDVETPDAGAPQLGGVPTTPSDQVPPDEGDGGPPSS